MEVPKFSYLPCPNPNELHLLPVIESAIKWIQYHQQNNIIEELNWHLNQENLLNQEVIQYALKAHLNQL
jgi:hypothetical protein